MSYLATTSSSSKINPQYTSKPLRSNSQNRILSPTFNNSYDRNIYASLSRKPERLQRHASLGTETIINSGSSSSLRLDNFVTLHRRRSDFNAPSIHSPSPSPMVLSPSNTRQFFNNGRSPSREGSITPRFSHSCSNASLVTNEPTERD